MWSLIEASWIVTAATEGDEVRATPKGAVAIDAEGRILAAGCREDVVAAARSPDAPEPAERVVLDGHILMPGLVNAHTHAAMTLLRGHGDDRALDDWLKHYIWPAEAELVDPEFVRVGTLLAAAEMLAGGITTCADMYFFPGAAGRAFVRMGMRAQLAMPVLDFPTRYASDADGYLRANLDARDALADEPLLSWALGPHAPYTVSDATYTRVLAFASELDIPIHTHLQETADEVATSRARHGGTPAARLARLGVASAGLVAAHGVHLEGADRSLLAQAGASVIHCPSSNLKLASGLADVAALLRAGVNVGLGTDGAASNNRLDLFEEMRLAALLAKAVSRDAASVPATRAFLLATRNGARALRLDDRIGTLEVGKRADLVAVRIDTPAATPMFDPVSHLVYVAGRADVTHVWVDGRARVTEGRLAEGLRVALAECAGSIATFADRVSALRP